MAARSLGCEMTNTQSCRAYFNVFKMCGYKDSRLYSVDAAYARSPRILRANWMSFGMMVTRLAWIAQRLVSSKRPTR